MVEKLIAYFAKRHLLMNFVFIAVVIGGVFAWQHTNKEELPDITFDRIRISVRYPGASAEDVEFFVTRPMEEQIRGLDGVYRIKSTSSAGQANITVEIEQNYPDFDEALMELRNAVLDVDLPDEVIDDPNIRVFKTSKKAILDIALIHDDYHLLDVSGRKNLQKYSYALENRLLSLPEVHSVQRRGYLQEELQIKVDPARLLKYEIPFNTVMQQIRENHVRKPVGTLKAAKEPKVTILSELDSPQKLRDLTIQGGFDGRMIRLGEIANVDFGYEQSDTVYKVNGHEAVIFSVVKNSSHGILEALAAVEGVVANFRENNLSGTAIQLVLLDDESIDVQNRLSIIAVNGGIGFVMILVTLFVFLNVRAGIWVAMGIPFTFCCTMIFAAAIGYTINGTTLAAVIIVMGMVVDDAIVVAENITRLRRQGMEREEAVIKGTSFVLLPIVASIATTCVAFVPLFFFTGHAGKFIQFIPPIIFFMLIASLFESLLILPGHMGLHISLPGMGCRQVDESNGMGTHWFDRVELAYARFLEKSMRFSWLVLLGFACLLVVAGFIVVSKMKYEMFPREETRDIVLTGTAPAGTKRYETALLVRQIEDIVLPYVGTEVVGIRTSIARSRRGGAVEENKFRMLIEIVPKEDRDKSADELVAEFKEGTDALTAFEEIRFAKSRWGQQSGSPIEILVQQNNDTLRGEVVARLAKEMRARPALDNVEIDEGLSVPEYRIEINRDVIKRLSISPADVVSTFRAALEGTILYEFTDGDENIRVRLTTDDDTKSSIDHILDLPVENRRDYLVSLRNIVTVHKVVSPNAISRRDLKRTSVVFADMHKDTDMTPVEVAEELEATVFPGILSEYPTTSLSFSGEVQDTRETTADLRNAVIMAGVLIYIILSVLFNSLWKPVIIMLAIPFGVVGIILAFYFHGKTVYGFYAAVGALGLAGVVVNDAIIMLVKLNKEFDSASDLSVSRQVGAIASTRLRAVILTTLTTVAGVLPTAYGFAGYDAMLAEMMLALTWGLIFGTMITLILVPCVFGLEQSLKSKFRNRWNKNASLRKAAVIPVVILLSGVLASAIAEESEEGISLDSVVSRAALNDTEFEEILIEELTLRYQKDLRLPARDLVLSLKQEYNAFLSQDRTASRSVIGLSKLFPRSGTELSIAYEVSPSFSSDDSSGSASLGITQPIARNAFGSSTRLQEQIIGIEIDIASHQIVEAYEDYLAAIITAYHRWLESHENLLIGRSSYRENMKLLGNIQERRKKQVARAIDVNKINLQVLAKKERLVELETEYEKRLLTIQRVIRHDGKSTLVPMSSPVVAEMEGSFGDAFSVFVDTSRTFNVLRLLEEKSSLEVDKDADDLLPSINLVLGGELRGDGYGMDDNDDLLFAGIAMEWPFPSQVASAEHKLSKIDLRRSRLLIGNARYRLHTDIKDLFYEIRKEKRLKEIAEEKIHLAQSILQDETENYSFAKVSLNDYIDAVNTLDRNRFTMILHDARHRILMVEWLRLTDRLITKKEIRRRHMRSSD